MKVKKWEEWYKGGQLKEVKNLKVIRKKSKANDVVLKGRTQKISVKHGEFKAFSSRDFQLTEEGKYKKGVKHGTWVAYYPGGRTPTVICNYKKGKLHGVYKTFDRRGRLIQRGDYAKGVKHGKMQFYNSKGKVIKEMNYRYGRRVNMYSNKNFRP